MAVVIGMVASVVLGWYSASFVRAQGWAGLQTYLLMVVFVPLVAGTMVRRGSVLVALTFNIALAASMVEQNNQWYAEHGFNLAEQARRDAASKVLLFALAIPAAFLSMLPRVLLKRRSR